jgi:hypothetical protein
LALHIFCSCGIVSNPGPFKLIVAFIFGSYLAHYLYFGICGLILSPCPFSPQLARRRRMRKTKKKQKKEDEKEEEERCSPN